MKLLQASSLTLTLGDRRILHDIDIELESGEILGLIGPNGAGKSCLLRLLAGLYPAASDSIRIAGEPLSALTLQERAKRIAWLAQQAEVHWPISVETLVELGRSPHLRGWGGGLSPQDQLAVEQVLQATDLSSLRQRTYDTLSGGEKARVLLARTLAGEPQLLLADEPLAALDPAHQLDVMELLQKFRGRDKGVILILHDLRLAAGFCDRLLLLHQGRVVGVGRPEQVLTAENLSRSYQIELREESSRAFSLPWRRCSGDVTC